MACIGIGNRGAATLTLGGHTDWRLPIIKELYSLILFSGLDASPCMNAGACTAVAFLDTNYFRFQYGDTNARERIIDAQYWSSTEYVSTTMGGNATAFGVNFADGRIKGYPTRLDGGIRRLTDGTEGTGAVRISPVIFVCGNHDGKYALAQAGNALPGNESWFGLDHGNSRSIFPNTEAETSVAGTVCVAGERTGKLCLTADGVRNTATM